MEVGIDRRNILQGFASRADDWHEGGVARSGQQALLPQPQYRLGHIQVLRQGLINQCIERRVIP